MRRRIGCAMIIALLAAGCAATQKPSGRLEDGTQSRAIVTEVTLPGQLPFIAGRAALVTKARPNDDPSLTTRRGSPCSMGLRQLGGSQA
jgi:hypothetical protein